MKTTKTLALLILLFITPFIGISQNFEKITLDSSDPTNYYLVVKPSAQVRGVMVLLPGFGGVPENIFPETKLHNTAYVNGIMTVALGVGNKVYADKPVVDKINNVLKDVVTRFSVSPENFVMGGFSAGGTISLRYVQLSVEKPAEFPVKFKGVFTVDSPIDLVDIFKYFERELEKNFSDAGVNEAKFVKDIMLREIGSPTTDLEAYKKLTPFYKENEGYGNEKFLKDIAVRAYHDIDVSWQHNNRRRSLYDCNCLNSSEMINRLMLMGNERAEFIQSKTRGIRSSGQQHPHSWSIVDEVEAIQWMDKLFN
ncbi:MAG TPA: hypothetical protein VD908_01795 [Cytophagales bacterium]|nr:hypothetical protein [Cytophagales bacterium]